MGLLGDLNDPHRAARARMEAEEKKFKHSREAGGTDAAGNPLPRRPQRYKLYDRIKDKVSVTTMNVIIGATVLLLILALIVGIATGNPQ